jgi:hypothetical protein
LPQDRVRDRRLASGGQHRDRLNCRHPIGPWQTGWQRAGAVHAADVNPPFGLTGGAMLRPWIADLPLIWFEGDVERINPGQMGCW